MNIRQKCDPTFILDRTTHLQVQTPARHVVLYELDQILYLAVQGDDSTRGGKDCINDESKSTPMNPRIAALFSFLLHLAPMPLCESIPHVLAFLWQRWPQILH